MSLTAPPSPSVQSLEFSRSVPPSPSAQSRAVLPNVEDRRMQAIRDYDERQRQRAIAAEEQQRTLLRKIEDTANEKRIKLLTDYAKLIQSSADEDNPLYENLLQLLKNPTPASFEIWTQTVNGLNYGPVKLLPYKLSYAEQREILGTYNHHETESLICSALEIHSPNSIFHTCWLSIGLSSVKDYYSNYPVIDVLLTLHDPRLSAPMGITTVPSNPQKVQSCCVIL